MLTFVFLTFVLFFLVPGIFLSLEATKRKHPPAPGAGTSASAPASTGNRPTLGRAAIPNRN